MPVLLSSTLNLQPSPPSMAPQLLLLLFFLPLLLLIIIAITTTGTNYKKKTIKLPPSPPKLPLIGNLHQLGHLPHRALRDLSQRYGPLIHLRLGHVPAIVVSSSEAAHEMMTVRDLSFSSRPKLKVANKLTYKYKSVSFAPYGHYWRQVRKLCVLHLLSAKRVNSFRPAREAEVARTIADIADRASTSKPINLTSMFRALAINILCKVALGRSSSVDDEESRMLHESIVEVATLFSRFNVEDYFPRFKWLNVFTDIDARVERTFRKLDGFIDGVVEDHKKKVGHGDGGDLVDVLLSLQKEHSMEFSLAKDDVKALILNMFGAGTATSSVFLEWAMSELIRNPKVMKKLKEEVSGIKKEGHHIVTEEDLIGMQYLKAVIKEVLRLHPPAPLLVPREAVEDTELQGYSVPAKTRVIVNAWAIGRDPRFWITPEEFIPERFMDGKLDFKGHNFEFIPFGGGRRMCPGMQFGVATIELALANVVYHFDWEMQGGMNAEDLDMEEAAGLTAHRKNQLILMAKHVSPTQA